MKRTMICKVCGKLKAEVEMAYSRIYKGRIYRKRTCQKCSYANYTKKWIKENKEKYRVAHELGAKRYRQKYPERHSARIKARYWVEKGRMAHLACQVCGNFLSEMHHPDYNFPLDVWWFCKKHHAMANKGELKLYA